MHFPAGAVPKDGPSAGITMTTALVSLFIGRPVKANVAMTGEVTLQGRVLPIGGVKQKLLAAHWLGLTEIIIPVCNEPDLDDLPQAVRDELTGHLASDVADVIGWAFGSPRAGRRRLTEPTKSLHFCTGCVQKCDDFASGEVRRGAALSRRGRRGRGPWGGR
ncbi:hypothetical protein KSP35_00035 [Aquihabitans sp. G128]|nr:hypothetical protein KSP35_00035 [Aquihabitans sp. G128]